MRTIDMTPTWSEILQVMLIAFEESSAGSNRDDLIREFQRMADAADRWNDHAKKMAAK